MKSDHLLVECQQAGLTLSMDAQGGLSIEGDSELVARFLPTLHQHKPELLRQLAKKTDPVTYWRIVITRPDGRVFEVDSPSGMTLDEARDFADRYHGPGCAVSGLVSLVDAYRGGPTPTTKPPKVRCSDCNHATATDGPSMTDD